MMAELIDGYTTLGTERETTLSAADLLRQMDAAGVDRAVIAPQDREIAIENHAGNARMLAAAADSGGRFIPACSVNPWRGDEVHQLLSEAHAGGAKLLVLAPMLQGFIPTDELADPLLRCAGELGLPVYIHTGPHSSGGPTQVVLVAERHPDTNFILGHGGSTDYARDMQAILKHHALPNVWFELSLVRPWVVPHYVETAGGERCIFGSSAPRNSLPFELQQFDATLPIADWPDVYGGNLARLIGV
jgi:predicted TIM-barrel fold metal-dependent hydrolase